jgi:hypothetical protein
MMTNNKLKQDKENKNGHESTVQLEALKAIKDLGAEERKPVREGPPELDFT